MKESINTIRLLALALIVIALVLAAQHAFPAALCLIPFGLGILLRGRNSRKELEQQAAFEEAERKRATLRANAAFESFVNSSPVSIEIYDTAGKLLTSNKAAERLLGKIPPVGISLFDERGLKRNGLLEPQLKRVLAGTRVETPPTWYDPTEIGLPGIPGRKICFRATVFPLFGAEGNVTRIAVVHEDITELKKLEQELKEAEIQPSVSTGIPIPEDIRELEFRRRKVEQALRECEETHRALVEGPQTYIVIRLTEDGRVTGISPSVKTVWGVSAETILTDPSAFFAQVHPDDLEQVKQTETRIRRTNEYPEEYRFRVINKASGQTRWVEIRGSVCKVAGKKTLNAIALDITHLVTIEQALKQKTTDIKSLLTSTSDGIIVVDKNLTVTLWSKGAEKETQISAKETVGKPLVKIYPDIRNTRFFPALKKTLDERVSTRSEAFYNDGRKQYAGWFSISSYPFESGLLLMVSNITRQKNAELAWQDAKSKLKVLMESSGLAITVKDLKLRYTLVNANAFRMLGVAEGADLEGKTCKDILNPTVANLLSSQDRKVIHDGKTVEIELALPNAISPDSTWYHIIKSPLRNSSNETVGVLDLGFDISKRVQAQQELSRRRDYFQKLLKEQAATLRKAKKELQLWEKP